jgi:hypothetical protein
MRTIATSTFEAAERAAGDEEHDVPHHKKAQIQRQ